jgi:hypothetical protein
LFDIQAEEAELDIETEVAVQDMAVVVNILVVVEELHYRYY